MPLPAVGRPASPRTGRLRPADLRGPAGRARLGRAPIAGLSDPAGGSAEIALPDPCLVVLIGPAGAGKSTFARRWFAADEVLSSDAFRGRLGRDEDDQRASGRAFRALHTALDERLRSGRLTVVDATSIRTEARRPLLRAAAGAGLPAVAIVLDMSLDECMAGDLARADRHVGRAVIERQWAALRPLIETADAGPAVAVPEFAVPEVAVPEVTDPGVADTSARTVPLLLAEGFNEAIRLAGRPAVDTARVRRTSGSSRTIGARPGTGSQPR
ncbi:MAG: AAA family ATPase [Candidatus Limnocylindrales bacterium]